MDKAEQTQEVKEKLYYLTKQFVYKYQPRYYKQYRGDLEDLVLDFYCQFLTPKSRIKGQEKSLLDRYDVSKKPIGFSEELYFANLVKVSVQRMLIDRSRQDHYRILSIDKFLEAYGDMFVENFNLSVVPSDDSLDFNHFLLSYHKMSPALKQSLRQIYQECRNSLSESFTKVFDLLFCTFLTITLTDGTLCLVQQVTPKTVCAFISSYNMVLDFDRHTGICRSSKDLSIDSSSLVKVNKYPKYHSSLSRTEFEDICRTSSYKYVVNY